MKTGLYKMDLMYNFRLQTQQTSHYFCFLGGAPDLVEALALLALEVTVSLSLPSTADETSASAACTPGSSTCSAEEVSTTAGCGLSFEGPRNRERLAPRLGADETPADGVDGLNLAAEEVGNWPEGDHGQSELADEDLKVTQEVSVLQAA